MTEKIYEDDKELGVYEARVLNKQYSDDDWKLTKYTSELRNNNDNSFYCFVDFNADDVGTIRECPHCIQYEIHNKLQPRILKKGEVRPPDYDQFVQCYECGNVFPIYEGHFESKIKDSLETTDNPFESNESIFLATETRKEQRKKDKKRKGRFSSKEHEDPEIDELLRRYGKNVKIIYDSNP
jgi:hypothetical protein